ncbi:hypothetical protein [Pediococcus parvulus]|uniref:hypothetical protein n=1 Tax=Pediococcus parvulus TaxID=54062 RepID=UPI0021A6B5EC|nr:hypothetical protein [Pediococcus parvulus]MCT3035885.1 hypothetical protein [Pediococcus parvulus]
MQEVWFYSILIFVVTWYFNIIPINVVNIFRAIFPFITAEYWFVSAYIMLIILIPFLNIVSTQLNYREHVILLFVLISFDSLSLIKNGTMTDYLASFMIVYFIGTFLRKYLDKLSSIKNWMLYINVVILWMVEIISMEILFKKGYGIESVRFTDKLLAFSGATSIFLIFLRARKFYSSIVNKMAKTVFAAYLLTDNPFARNFVWNNIFQTFKFQDYIWVPLYGLLCVAVIMLVTIVIDTARIKLFKMVKHHIVN